MKWLKIKQLKNHWNLKELKSNLFLQGELKRNNAALDITTNVIKKGDAILHKDCSVIVPNEPPQR